MIIVEGLDNSGKTTLVERLVKDFPELEHHRSISSEGKDHGDWIKAASWEMLDKDRKNPLVIYDRSRFISEYIYKPVIKYRKLSFGLDDYFMMLGQYLKRPQLLIYCQRPIEKVTATLDERDQLKGVSENIYQLHEAYEDVMNFLGYMFKVVGMAPGDQQGTGMYYYDYERVGYETLSPIVQGYVNRFAKVVP